MKAENAKEKKREEKERNNYVRLVVLCGVWAYIYIYFLNMFHIFSLVCFLIYGVNRRQVLCFLEDFALTWSFWDMMDMSMFRLLVQFRTFRVKKWYFDEIYK